MNVTTALDPSAPIRPAGPATAVTCGAAGLPAQFRRRPALRGWWRPQGSWAVRRWRAVREAAAESGMSTAEYAVGTVAACAFAAVLYKVVTSPAVSSALGAMIKKALGVAV